MTEEKKEKCLFPGCNKEKLVRGLCTHNHYIHAARLVKAGKITWRMLEQKGKAKPTKNEGHETFTKWLLES